MQKDAMVCFCTVTAAAPTAPRSLSRLFANMAIAHRPLRIHV